MHPLEGEFRNVNIQNTGALPYGCLWAVRKGEHQPSPLFPSILSPLGRTKAFFQPLQDQLVINFRLDFRNSAVSPKVLIPKYYFKFWLLQSKYLPANSLSPYSSAGTHIHLTVHRKVKNWECS